MAKPVVYIRWGIADSDGKSLGHLYVPCELAHGDRSCTALPVFVRERKDDNKIIVFCKAAWMFIARLLNNG